jgi:ribose transport system substrate-binding protein
MKHFVRKIVPFVLLAAAAAQAADYPQAQPLNAGSQADTTKLKPGKTVTVAYMPPATEFAYYMAIGEGVKAVGGKTGVKTFMLAPQSGADINGQMGMIQDAITRKVDGIILATHDESAAAPLVKQAVDKGIAVVIVNSDITSFPTPVHGVVGYSQRKGTQKMGEYLLKLSNGSPLKVGLIAGQPGYHSTERLGGFVDALKGKPGVEMVATVPGGWNVEGGNTAAMDLLQANPKVDVLFAANDYMLMGAAQAAKALGRTNMRLLGNDGDTAGLEQIQGGVLTATVNTGPYTMGEMAMSVILDALAGRFKGGFVETPTTIVDKNNVLPVLKKPDSLYPKPSKAY